jgi:hypothetical protein
MCRYLFSLIAICFALVAAGQGATQKKIRTDTVSGKYLPTGVRIGIDALSLIKSKDNSFKGWEINIDTDFSRYYLTVDYGYWATNQQLGNGKYTNAGNYIRIGADINFLLKDPEKNMFFIGFRYGISEFNESVQYTNAASYRGFGINSYSLSNGSLNGHWFEITTGLRVRIVSGFWMGTTARLKFAPTVSGAGKLAAYDMPGYGIVEETPYWGFNYQLFWRIPLPRFKK